MNVLHMTDLNLSGKRVLIREDLNVPVKGGKVVSDARILASLPTIKLALEAGAKVMAISHLGRPTEGVYDEQYSLRPVAEYISNLLKQNVRFITDWIDGDFEVAEGELVILENVRFNKGENNNDEVLSKKMAALCDVYVMDAFGTAHRAQASTYGVGIYADIACSGPLLTRELDALSKAFDDPEKPMVAIVGGSKVSSKLTVLESLSKVCDQLIVGGGIANTFLAAAGKNVGKSLYEKNLIHQARALMEKVDVPLPVDVVCGKKFDENEPAVIKHVNEVSDDDMIFDVGPETQKLFTSILKNVKTILWNGPVGVFEIEQFGAGTRSISKAIAESSAFSVAGGGDTLAAIDKYHVSKQISYISTGGGAFLEFVEGKRLPAVVMLEQACLK
ncbi:MAG: phosphoglycerate kinase [Candidatus Endonucleobacter bathymodioli]|uniref:Phosphoglycerate kinase n=1 Tax=Candidatus Endonucleibacter bathymodioli TaxID=539814 RepID=A0AA90SY99_9GAMM|nr:phosphoglycerate kinase [Candidatus Endonucleobacter bathymodioli]